MSLNAKLRMACPPYGRLGFKHIHFSNIEYSVSDVA